MLEKIKWNKPLLSGLAETLYESVRDLPIVSPHGHCDPAWFASNKPFADPADLLIVPDHYVFRMLYSQGLALETLGIGVPIVNRDPRAIFRLLAQNWHLFLGTPSRQWLEHTFHHVLQIDEPLNSENADRIYDQIDALLKTENFLPRNLFDAFNIDLLATTDSAVDALTDHATIKTSGWTGRVIPTFRPDTVLDPHNPNFSKDIQRLGEITDLDIGNFSNYLNAIRQRRAFFKRAGATATDHGVTNLTTEVLTPNQIEQLFAQALSGKISPQDASRFYGHMLVEMARMSIDDGLVMQIHAGAERNTNRRIFEKFGADKGADIPKRTDWVAGLNGLLNDCGNNNALSVIAFTLDESGYARELAPMAGHWPALKLGPPWWFHDSLNGIARYFDQVVESAGYRNLAGFNDDTRAFLSIPARHDLWRRGVALHLEKQVGLNLFDVSDAHDLAKLLSRDMAVAAYNLETK